jgi:hypothetical protein
VTTQLWDWHDESPVYEMTHLQVHEIEPQRWVAESRTTTYRAWRRSELAALATDVGLRRVRWVDPPESGFFQPIMAANV